MKEFFSSFCVARVCQHQLGFLVLYSYGGATVRCRSDLKYKRAKTSSRSKAFQTVGLVPRRSTAIAVSAVATTLQRQLATGQTTLLWWRRKSSRLINLDLERVKRHKLPSRRRIHHYHRCQMFKGERSFTCSPVSSLHSAFCRRL